ncbi:hypothetical protein [Neobacillus vireti]|uniref:hypothetical protein n=1 Tax=Neobacillus vireti TaxID=220686 RepID=UPI002FFF7782
MKRFKTKVTTLVASILLTGTLVPGSGGFLAEELSIESVYFTDNEQAKYPENATIESLPQAVRDLDVKGVMADGSVVDIPNTKVTLESGNTEVAAVDSDGIVNAKADGVAKISATVSSGDVTKSTSVFMQVRNPEDRFVDAALLHDKMTIEIGEPALLESGDQIPSIQLEPFVNGTVTAELIKDGKVIQTVQEKALNKGNNEEITFQGLVNGKGHYEIHLVYHFDGQPQHDSFFFTVLDEPKVGGNESKIVYVGKDGTLEYTPDYKGNQILDFSNAGYQGGGVKIPDVQAKVVLSPVEGDDTASIQAAIDEVSALPMNESGFRGAVVLEKGTFEINNPLTIQASGVVLRGKGQEEDGTIVLSTSTKQINMLELKGIEGITINEEVKEKITELYVPVGSRSFHVENAENFNVGDEIIVRRYGNAHWIHEIDMDQIVKDPGPDTDGTLQWEPFNLEFDRVITAINGNIVTVDAPLADSIDVRWGGGEILKYQDERIENVGVENIRFDTVFDPSVTKVHNNGETYYADEKHANTAIRIDKAKNAWVREVTGLHFRYSLVDISKASKWVTVQDTKSLDMVSQITGSRRYPYKYGGQLLLTQRVYANTARHAFLVDSRVMGPNVFLDSVGEINYTKSEPHHRWSVGGLFDNIKAPIAIQDRQWYGTGHGWSGANYVAWNTEGDLIIQQPPTAQNYSIGHVGAIEPGDWPKAGDMRPREQGYVESHGKHVKPKSLYLQQLEDRLGKQAVKNIKQTPVGGKDLDIPVSSN